MCVPVIIVGSIYNCTDLNQILFKYYHQHLSQQELDDCNSARPRMMMIQI